ncbi:venom allergen 5 [Clonorchis sinensis]|uniref:Venom allergen 5 n=1 Tax=Clonorchis sinensis TaxID=79923 RepID=G7YEN0_CLOSI|nr:venom allergen 5 [Clonorchis sinensis]
MRRHFAHIFIAILIFAYHSQCNFVELEVVETLFYTNTCTSCETRNVEDPFGPIELLQRHNQYRRMILSGRVINQPAASAMLNLEWDTTLAEGARLWAEKCDYRHELPQSVGENLAFSPHPHIEYVIVPCLLQIGFQ